MDFTTVTPPSLLESVAEALLRRKKVNVDLTDYSTSSIFLALHCLHKTIFPDDCNAQLSFQNGVFTASTKRRECLVGFINSDGGLHIKFAME